MLSSDDRALANRDGLLPELGTLLDSAAFRAALTESFPSLTVGPVIPRYLRYKPATSCLAAYSATIDGQLIELHALTASAEAKVRLRPRDRTVSTEFGPGGCRLGERPIVVRAFPRDAKLKRLVALADPVRRQRMLPSVLGPGEMFTVGYKPERRFVGRLEVGSRQYSVKMHAPGRFPAAYEGAKAFESVAGLTVAPLVFADSRSGLVVQRWLPGETLAECQGRDDWAAEEARAVGAALAALHAQRPRNIGRPAQQGESLLEFGEGLAHLVPAAAGPWRTHAATLFGAADELAEPSGPVHGDFYAKQVLVREGRAAILDCDQARVGDQAEDLGTFRAHLLRDVLRDRIDAGRADSIWEEFLAGYGSGGTDFRLRVDLFTAIACFRLALDPFRHREPAWEKAVRGLVALSVAAFAPILGVHNAGGSP